MMQSRTRHALALLILLMLTVNLSRATPAAAGIPPPTYYPLGPQINVDPSQLVGWEPCWSSTYASTGIPLSTILSDCSGSYLLLASRPAGNTAFEVLAAAPRADVIFDTGTGNTPHNANGTGWYYNGSWSWGFALQGDAINRNSCDIVASSIGAGANGALRLCWHTSAGAIGAGWRSGVNDSQFSVAYERFIFQPTQVSVSMSSAALDPTNTSPIPVSVSFSESVTGFTATDITPGNGVVSNFAGSGASYSFDLTPAGQGLVTADIAAGAAQNTVGNLSAAALQFRRTYDTISPGATINQAIGQADPASAAPINFTVVLTEPVASFAAKEVTLGGTAPGTLSASITGGPTTYTVAVSGMTGSGTVTATIAAGALIDLAGNVGAASTSTDNSVTFNSTLPVVTGIVRADPNPTRATSAQFTVTFSKSVTGVDTADFVATTTGITGATITGVTGSGATRTVAVSTGVGDGSLRLDLIDNDTIIDGIGGALGGSGAGNGSFTGETYTVDKTAPQAGGLVAANISAPGAATHSFTVLYSDNLAVDYSTLDSSDVRVVGPGGFSQLATFVSVDPATNGTPRTATYQITAPGGAWDTADDGSYSVALQANQVLDTAGNAAGVGALGTFSVSISAASYTTSLPLVARAGVPDLIITISVSPDKRAFTAGELAEVVVMVTNQGSAAAGAFWVDLYLNPSSPPAAANQIWNDRCGLTPCFGMAWQVPGGLAPGESITLSSQSVAAGYSIWPGWFAAGTTDLYAYADSYNPGVTVGAIAELDETNNLGELHGLSVSGPNPTLARQPTAARVSARPIAR